MKGLKRICLSIFLGAMPGSISAAHEIYTDFGSYRDGYIYDISELGYISPDFSPLGVRFSAKLRSYGALFYYSKSAYDITPVLDFALWSPFAGAKLYAGGGLDARIRLVRDERSDAVSSVESMLTVTAVLNWRSWGLQMPVYSKFYSNGIAVQILPRLEFRITEKIFVFGRYELSWLKIYQAPNSEWWYDCFLGVGIRFG